MKSAWILIMVTVILLHISVVISSSDNTTEASRVLSRRKRYLVFPEGSSLQLVFCVQTVALIPIGDIFLYGSTIALAWMLPTDPQLLTMFKDHGITRRRQDLNEIYYLDEDGKVIARVPYKRKVIINPAFSKRSADDQKITFKEKLKIRIDRAKMHKKQLDREYLNTKHMNEKTILFHRASRVGLYEKLEKLFTALGGGGRQCVLRKLCESARSAAQGTFFQELNRAVFTLPKGNEFHKEEHKDYDKAHHSKIEDCSTTYPGCGEFEIYEQMLTK